MKNFVYRKDLEKGTRFTPEGHYTEGYIERSSLPRVTSLYDPFELST